MYTFAHAHLVEYDEIPDPDKLSASEKPIGALVLSLQAVWYLSLALFKIGSILFYRFLKLGNLGNLSKIKGRPIFFQPTIMAITLKKFWPMSNLIAVPQAQDEGSKLSTTVVLPSICQQFKVLPMNIGPVFSKLQVLISILKKGEFLNRGRCRAA
jgi:hypothetical protein